MKALVDFDREKSPFFAIECKTGIGKRLFIARLIAALVSGLMLSAAFPPLCLNWLAWFAFVPLIILPQPLLWKERFFVGYLWGYTHFASSLLWLNEVGFAAGWLLATYCALYPMLWYFIFSGMINKLQRNKETTKLGSGILYISNLKKSFFISLFAAASWCTLEWIRAWLFSGFPWNQLGISQFERTTLLKSAAYAGVYGISFLIVLSNLCLSNEICQILRRIFSRKGRKFTWHLALFACFCLPFYLSGTGNEISPDEDTQYLKILAVQGNMPQCREWTDEDFEEALHRYTFLTRAGIAEESDIDLVVWPECAVPASLGYAPYTDALKKMQDETKTPLLFGATNYRHLENDVEYKSLFNSAFLIDEQFQINAYYDKIHRVPFGEFVPASKYFPILVEWIGMGRDLTPGLSYSIFNLPKGARAGVNICFEDVFPEVSRNFTLRGANVLMTITNDSWYKESAGAWQHFSHVVFRAAECRRPVLRSGQNSYTCLISPYGKVISCLTNKMNGSPFVKGSKSFYMPVQDKLGITFYTKYGNIFAFCCVIFTGVSILQVLLSWYKNKKVLLQTISEKAA